MLSVLLSTALTLRAGAPTALPSAGKAPWALAVADSVPHPLAARGHWQTSAVSRLIVSDIQRCVEECAFIDECVVSFREAPTLETMLRKVDGVVELGRRVRRYVASRRPLVEWAAHSYLTRQFGPETVCNMVPWHPQSLTLAAALAPLQPWGLIRQAIVVAPRRVLQAAAAYVLLCLHRGRADRRVRWREAMLVHLASAYERLSLDGAGSRRRALPAALLFRGH